MLVSFRGLATHNNFLPQKLMLCRQLLNSCVPYHLHGNGGRGCAVLYQAGELLNNNAIAPRCYYTLPGLFLPKGKNFFFQQEIETKGGLQCTTDLTAIKKNRQIPTHFWHQGIAQCLKITQKVSFHNIASEASYIQFQFFWRENSN